MRCLEESRGRGRGSEPHWLGDEGVGEEGGAPTGSEFCLEPALPAVLETIAAVIPSDK